MDQPQKGLLKQLEEKIKAGETLMQYVSDIKSVNGILKLKNKIKQEINFLLKVLTSKEAKKEHLLCTNLHHFEALVSCLISSYGSVAVLQYFALSRTDGSSKRICVDIVAENGQSWIKVIARNPKALFQLSTGKGEFGQRSIIDHAVEYLECAHQHPHHFKTPKVVFEFACGIERLLADHLESLGVTVTGEKLEMIESVLQEAQSNSDEELQSSETVHSLVEDLVISDKLNLDVTAMLAYVSSLTNGGSYFEFKEPILTQQAEWERAKPVKPILSQLFKGKCLICCESAMKDFKSIVSTLGGPGEVRRANDLISYITVKPNMIASRAQERLRLGGKIKQRSLAVFSTGDAMKAITVTANEGFVRAARNQVKRYKFSGHNDLVRWPAHSPDLNPLDFYFWGHMKTLIYFQEVDELMQGVEFAVFVHESRALTERKEQDAKVIVPTSDSTVYTTLVNNS